MIVMNDDYRNAPPSKKGHYMFKGRIINNFLVIEDVRDVNVRKAGQHKVVVKCLNCGHISEHPAFVEKLKTGEYVCRCQRKKTGKASKYVVSREKMLRFLTKERNMANDEAFYPEDMERVLEYDKIIKFLSCQAVRNFFKNHLTNSPDGDTMFVDTERERKKYEGNY